MKLPLSSHLLGQHFKSMGVNNFSINETKCTKRYKGVPNGALKQRYAAIVVIDKDDFQINVCVIFDITVERNDTAKLGALITINKSNSYSNAKTAYDNVAFEG